MLTPSLMVPVCMWSVYVECACATPLAQWPARNNEGVSRGLCRLEVSAKP